jgi:HPt (histidine-containing phosphotransfer) domain-containing protein
VTADKNLPPDPIPSDLVQEDASFEEIVRQFVDGLGQRVTDMEHALTTGDLDTVKRVAHQLKGTGGGHGYALLSEAAAQMECDTVNGDLTALRRDMEDLKALVSRVVVRLD